MSRDDSRPQIGSVDVDPEALQEPGEPLVDLMSRFAMGDPEPAMLADLPIDGWRILDRPQRGSVILGAPVDPGGTLWRIGEVGPEREGSNRRLAMHREPQPLRPSRAFRRGGLALRWPNTTRDEPDLDLLAIDIINTGAERWRPAGDSFHVAGALDRTGASQAILYFAYLGGSHPAMPLDPGEYVRTRVSIGQNVSWDRTEPGRYHVRAVLGDLGLEAEPLPIELTVGLIEARRARERAMRERFPLEPGR